jgi:hypothetical protein
VDHSRRTKLARQAEPTEAAKINPTQLTKKWQAILTSCEVDNLEGERHSSTCVDATQCGAQKEGGQNKKGGDPVG